MKKISKKIISLALAFITVFSAFGGFLSIDANAAGSWVCSWATSIVNSSASVAMLNLQDVIPSGSTVRIELKVTTGGDKLRFKFSNEHGAAPIRFNEVSVAKTVGEGAANIDVATAKAITFNGSKEVSIAAGATLWSDPVSFKTEALDKLSVSIYCASPTYITSAGLSNAKSYLAMGSFFGGNSSKCFSADIGSTREITIGSGTISYHTTPFLCAIDTYSSENKSTAVFIGDSTLVNDTYYYFAEKLVKAGIEDISVVNQAVVANKLLSDGTGIIGNLYGEALIERFNRDALNISGVKYVFVKIGLNDILHQFSKSMGADVPHYSAKEIIAGYKKLVEAAHAKGIKIYFFTKSSWKGYERAFLGQTGDIVWSKEMQDMCDELDKWIKSNNMADGYIDCSPLSNPADPYALCPSFTPDGAHLTPIAAVALADLIPVSFVGVNEDIKTSAKIHKVDPYKEKKQIIYDMEHPTEKPTEKPSEKPTERPSEKPSEVLTEKPEESTTAPIEESTTAKTEESTTVQQYIPQEIVTVPVIGNNQATSKYPGVGVQPNYNIQENVPTEIGDGVPLGFLLILFPVIIASGAVVFLTLTRKKEEEF